MDPRDDRTFAASAHAEAEDKWASEEDEGGGQDTNYEGRGGWGGRDDRTSAASAHAEAEDKSESEEDEGGGQDTKSRDRVGVGEDDG